MSGIYIKGMEMPQDGELLCINIYPDGKVCINLDLKCKRIATAIPVPDHGRLGDVDELAKRIEYERYHHEHTDGLAARHHIAEYSHFLGAIADTPTIIQASEEVYDKYTDTAGNLHWTGTHSGKHIIPAGKEGE